ncbi:hypothetical protein NA57DRAFT_72796 [Rhizodiscina lignyota]|uniref:MYND-type domain-containing protein n=1 Tax=Rhizodiscina lignyota TaxID=1504668 RepID=A0A9P4M891_9PEZI|nr:hypothetical protein NA57DRAFT_72796 [Rhizodiscina lignyota]
MAPPRCRLCDKAAHRVCAQCKLANYCNIDCVNLDQPFHSLLCTDGSDNSRPAFSELKRPAGDVTRCIFLPPDSDYPQWIWLPLENDKYRKQTMPKDHRVDELMGEGVDYTYGHIHNTFARRDHRGNIYVYTAFQREGAGLTVNRSVRMASAPHNVELLGPVLVAGSRDLEMDDFHIIIDHLVTWRTGVKGRELHPQVQDAK